MLRTLLELPGPDGRLRLAKLAGEDHDATLFVGLSVGPVAQVQRLNRGQVLDLVDVLDEWLFDTSREGRRSTVQPLNSRPAL